MPILEPSAWRPSRRRFTQLSLVVPWFARLQEPRAVQTTAGGEPQFVAPPDAPTAEIEARVHELAAALAAGKTSCDEILADPASNELRPYPLFRETIAKHAPMGRALLVPKGEPGVALAAKMCVLDREGKPYAGVRVYAYHTSAKGWYAAEAPHVSGNSGDYRFARLFAYCLTDAEGRCELGAVRPGPYPRSELPSHIHLQLEGRGGDQRGTEIRFEDCPRMTPAQHEASLRSGFVVVPVEKLADGSTRCEAEFQLPAS